jgi:hypothetical protein
MSAEKVVDYVKENKRVIIKRSLIIAAVTVGAYVTVILLKKDREMTKEYFDMIEDKTDTIDERLSIVRDILPGASFEEDNYGQILIYTGEYNKETT